MSVIEGLEKQVADLLATSVLKRIFPGDSEDISFFSAILQRGNSRMSLQPKLETPVIGLGAPASLVLGDAVKLLGGKLLLPENGDVANAVGAVTSEVSVATEARIVANTAGYFAVQGLEGIDEKESLDEAEELCLQALVERTKKIARKAGTSASRVSIEVEDKTAEAAGGELLFLERNYRARLTGAPDLV